MDPLAGVHAAVTRRRSDGEPATGWYPEQRISLEAALAAYSSGCAAAAGEEASVGKIAAGYRADFVVLSNDLFVIDPMEIPATRVETTVVGGEVVYRRA